MVLTINGISQGLNATVVRNDEDGLSLKFRINEAAEKLVEDLIAGRRAA